MMLSIGAATAVAIIDMIILMILGRTCGHVGRAEIIAFGKHNQNKFRKIGMLRNGIPSEATLCRVENSIDDLAMAELMINISMNFSRLIHFLAPK